MDGVAVGICCGRDLYGYDVCEAKRCALSVAQCAMPLRRSSALGCINARIFLFFNSGLSYCETVLVEIQCASKAE
jgi:hypothetical protein